MIKQNKVKSFVRIKYSNEILPVILLGLKQQFAGEETTIAGRRQQFTGEETSIIFGGNNNSPGRRQLKWT